MKLVIRREHLEACTGWLTSAIVHLLLLIVYALLLAPLPGNRSEVIEIETSFVNVEEVAALVELDVLPTWEPDLNLTSNPVADSPAELEVLPPGYVRSRGQPGPGRAGLESDSIDGAARGAGDANTVSFFGTQARGNCFVYVLDVSSSMNMSRLRRAILEMLRSIDELHEYQHFYVITFSWQTRLMFDESELFPTPIPATLQNKQRIRDWLAGLKTGSGTDPREALRLGMRLQPDAMFLLSDGEFNKPGTRDTTAPWMIDPIAQNESVIDVVHSEQLEGLPIHTVAFEIKRSEAEMKQIAEATHGIHRFVPANSATPKTGSNLPLRAEIMSFRFTGQPSDGTESP